MVSFLLKKTVMVILFISLQQPTALFSTEPSSYSTSGGDGSHFSLGGGVMVGIGITTFAAMGTFAWNAYTNWSLQKSCTILAKNKKRSEEITQQFKSDEYTLEEKPLIERYVGNESGYNDMLSVVKAHVDILSKIDTVTKKDIATWASCKRASNFLTDAQEFAHKNKTLLDFAESRFTFIEQRKCLLTLVSLLALEGKTKFAPIIESLIKKDKNTATESIIRRQYDTFPTPFRQTWKEIIERHNQYSSELDKVNIIAQSPYVLSIIAKSEAVILSFGHARNTIGSMKEYNNDFIREEDLAKAEKEYEFNQKRLAQDAINARAIEARAKADLSRAEAAKAQTEVAKIEAERDKAKAEAEKASAEAKIIEAQSRKIEAKSREEKVRQLIEKDLTKQTLHLKEINKHLSDSANEPKEIKLLEEQKEIIVARISELNRKLMALATNANQRVN